MRLLDILLETYKEEYELNLKEGLIKTTNIGKTIELLKKYYEKKIDIKRIDNTFEVIFIEKDINFLDNFLRDTNNLGWFPSYIKTQLYSGKWDKKYYNDQMSIIIFEAKFDEEIIENIPSILYHITPTQNVDKILKTGLAPKSRSKVSYHPERVYLGKSIESIEKLAPQMYQRIGNRNFTVLKINIDLIPGEYFKLYTDPNYSKEGYYTLNNIPPHVIEKIKDIKI
jgi:hypothetical protein